MWGGYAIKVNFIRITTYYKYYKGILWELATWLDLVAQDKITEARKLAKIESVEYHSEE